MSEQRLIDANALIQDLVSKRGFYPAIVKSAVEQAPTVPAESVVYCRDCNHYQEDNINWCTLDGTDRNPTDYCSSGERRESEESK